MVCPFTPSHGQHHNRADNGCTTDEHTGHDPMSSVLVLLVGLVFTIVQKFALPLPPKMYATGTPTVDTFC